MSAPSSTILLTGFGPFPGVAENASAALVGQLGQIARSRFPRRRIVTEVLETAWDTAPRRLQEIYRAHSPQVAVHFGVSEKAQGFVIETLARNTCRDTPDVRGIRPAQCWLSGGAPEAIPATLPVDLILARLEQIGLRAEHSDDAGGYLCNAVLFHALRLENMGRCGFVHIPANIGADGAMTWDEAIAGGLEIVRAALGLPARSQH